MNYQTMRLYEATEIDTELNIDIWKILQKEIFCFNCGNDCVVEFLLDPDVYFSVKERMKNLAKDSEDYKIYQDYLCLYEFFSTEIKEYETALIRICY